MDVYKTGTFLRQTENTEYNTKNRQTTWMTCHRPVYGQVIIGMRWLHINIWKGKTTERERERERDKLMDKRQRDKRTNDK